MNIFDSLRTYAGKWNVKDTRKFSAEEISLISSAVVVASDYGNSVCFFLKSGGQSYIPLSTDSTKAVGETVNIEEMSLITLGKNGEDDIVRVKC